VTVGVEPGGVLGAAFDVAGGQPGHMLTRCSGAVTTSHHVVVPWPVVPAAAALDTVRTSRKA